MGNEKVVFYALIKLNRMRKNKYLVTLAPVLRILETRNELELTVCLTVEVRYRSRLSGASAPSFSCSQNSLMQCI